MSLTRISNVQWFNPHADTGTQAVSVDVDAQGLRLSDHAQADVTMDGQGLWLMPAMYDLGQHLPRAGRAASAISHELQAAWTNGFGAVCAAPDTDPLVDNPAAMEWIMQRVGHDAQPRAQLHLIGALTQGLQGTQLSNMASLQQAGCHAVGQGDGPMPEVGLLRQALRYAADLDLGVHLTPQLNTTFAGCAHDGAVASRLGLSGIPGVSETLAVAMIVALVEDTGCRVHLTRLSSAGAVTRLRQAQAAGLPITAGVSLWNLLYTDQAIADYDARFHLNPPLRDETDQRALVDGVRDGTIGVISSDHRPLGQDAKLGPFADTQAGANGIDGFIAGLVKLVHEHKLPPARLAQSTSQAPRRVIGEEPDTKDWLLIDPNQAWTMQAHNVHSASRHTPWMGQSMHGALAGRITDGVCEIHQGWQGRLGV